MLIRHNYDGKRGTETIHIRLVPGLLSHDGILLLCDMFLTHGTYEITLQPGESRRDLAGLFKSLLPYRRIHIISNPELSEWDQVFAHIYHDNLVLDTCSDIDCDILLIDDRAQHHLNIEGIAQKASVIQLFCQ